MRLGALEVPRWLLIVVVILVVLAGGSCSIGVLRGDDGDSGDDIPGILKDLGPDPPPVRPAELSTTCARAGSRLTIVSDCLAVIEPTGDLRRRLRLEPVSGVVEIRVLHPRTSPPPSATLRVGDREDVVVGRDEGLDIRLSCRSLPCQVDLD